MPELQQLENQGWEQMLQMLNQHLPQEAPAQAPVRPIRILFVLAAAACLGVLFCMPVLLTDSRRPALPQLANADGPTAANPLSNPLLTNSTGSHLIPVIVSGKQVTVYHNRQSATALPVPASIYNNATNPATHADSSYSKILMALTETHVVAGTVAPPSAMVPATASDDKIPERLPLIFFPQVAPATPAQTTLNNKQALLSLAVQLNHNLNSQYYNTGNSLYNLPIYPSVTASVHVSKNISFSTGFSVMAPGSLNGQIHSETATPITNSHSDVASSMARVDRDMVKQAYYMEVPVTMDVAVRRNLAVSSGAGFAFLQKTLVQREARTTDANNNQFVSATTRPEVTNSLLSKEEVTETPAGRLYNIRSAERRFLLNVQYQLKNFHIGLQYSRALSPSVVFPQHPERNIRNQTISISVGMPLFRR